MAAGRFAAPALGRILAPVEQASSHNPGEHVLPVAPVQTAASRKGATVRAVGIRAVGSRPKHGCVMFGDALKTR
jgi:hypothetical protein